jgi:hypothetical protein
LLKEAYSYPEVFCYQTMSLCIILILDHLGFKIREGVTIHQITNELKIVNGFVPINKLGKFLNYFSEPIHIILHKSKEVRFPYKESE